MGDAVAPSEVSGLSTAKYSLPSEEVSGQQPYEHSGGVGALPGSKSESGVATLPGENLHGATPATSSVTGANARTFDTISKPSQDDQFADDSRMFGGREHAGGVGRLPGSNEEQGVAMLPDERNSARTDAGVVAGAAAVGAGVATGELAGAGANSAGMGKWALEEKQKPQQTPQGQGTTTGPTKVAEDQHMATSAKDAGAAVANTGSPADTMTPNQPQDQAQPPSKPQAVKEEVKETAKPDSAKEGEEHKGEKKFSQGKANQVSDSFTLFVSSIWCLAACGITRMSTLMLDGRGLSLQSTITRAAGRYRPRHPTPQAIIMVTDAMAMRM